MITFIACMNGYFFICAYYLLHLLLNKYWFVAHVTEWVSIINATFFSMKGIYPYEDTKTKRTFYRSLLFSALEVTLLWTLAFISKLFGNLVKEEVAESVPLLTLFSLVILSNPIGVYIQLRTFRRNNFFTACACGDLDILRELIQSPDIDFNSIDHYHRTGFIVACHYGQFQVVEFILKNAKWKDIDLNWRADNGLTGFHIACIRGHYEIVSFIMQHANDLCIDLFLKDFEGQTAFEMWPEVFTKTDTEIYLKQF